MPKMSSALPKGEKNGLSAIGPALVQRPDHSHVVIGVVTTQKITTDYEHGDVVATAKFLRIEALIPDDVPHAEQLMRRAMEKRNGGATLPIELEDELMAIFKTVDPVTGELLTNGDVFISHVDDEDDKGGADDDDA